MEFRRTLVRRKGVWRHGSCCGTRARIVAACARVVADHQL